MGGKGSDWVRKGSDWVVKGSDWVVKGSDWGSVRLFDKDRGRLDILHTMHVIRLVQ